MQVMLKHFVCLTLVLQKLFVLIHCRERLSLLNRSHAAKEREQGQRPLPALGQPRSDHCGLAAGGMRDVNGPADPHQAAAA